MAFGRQQVATRRPQPIRYAAARRAARALPPRAVLAWLVALAAAQAAVPACAAVRVQLQTTDGIGPLVSYNNSAPLTLQAEVVDGLSSAQGLTDMPGGVLKAKAVASQPGLANVATAAFSDQVTFTAGFGQTAYLDWSMDAAADTGIVYQNAAVLQLNVTRNQALTYELHALVSSGTCPSSYTTCTVGNGLATVGSMPIVIRTGTYTLEMVLTATSFAGTVDASNTVHAYLRLPPGAAAVSASGEFLANAAPIGQVPEAPGAALALTGFIGVLLASTRARQRQRG